ncbi:hypothetical protein QU39_00225, partial [Staphylococcus aureus]
AMDVLLHAQHLDPVATVRQHVAHRLDGVHQAALLVDDHAVQRVRELHFTLVGQDLAGEQLEQSRLARAIGADDADPVALGDAEGEVLDDRALVVPVAEALGDVLGVDHHLGVAVVGGGHQPGRALRPHHRGADRAHLLELFQPPLV